MKVKITKVREDAKLPQRAHYNDVGADVYTAERAVLRPHETVRIPLGISIEVPDGYMACIFPRSGMAYAGIVCEIPPIDPGYRGELYAIVSNLTDYTQSLVERTRVGQLVVIPCVICDFVKDLGDERGSGAFGSTGVK